jgi:propanol-preferring alcohol dehydrogenase
VRSCQFRDYGKPLEVVEAADPVPQGAEVVLRVVACGVCHSDVHVWEGHYDLGGGRRLDTRTGRPLPFTLGHEIVGEVVAIGPEADDALVGKHSVVFPWIGCGACEVCARGEEHLCLRPQALGTFAHGGFSDRVIVPHARYLFDFGDVLPERACTYACAGLTAYSALAKVGDHPGAHTIIVGAGGVGLNAVSIAKATSGREVVVVDIDADKLAAAEQVGADHLVDGSAPDAHKQLKRLTDGGAYAVVDCVGSKATASLGLRVLPRSGTLVIVGLIGGSLEVALPMMPLKDLTIRGSYLGSLREMGELMEIVRENKLRAIPIETRGLEEAQRTLDDLAAARVVGRVVLRP